MNKQNRKPLIGIDTVSFWVDGNDMFLPQNGTVTLRDEDDEFKWSGQNRVPFEGRFGAHTLWARTTKEGTKLGIEGSLYGWRYGQNLFTPCDLRNACQKALRGIQRRTGLKPSSTKQYWHDEEINLIRVDLFKQWRVGSNEEANQLIRRIMLQLALRGIKMVIANNYFLHMPQDGRKASMRGYNKRQEIAHNNRYDDQDVAKLIYDETAGLIRLELQLRTPELLAEKMSKASDWTEEKAGALFNKHLADLELFDIICPSVVLSEKFKSLPPRVQRAVAVVAHGIDPTDGPYSKDTWKKYKTELKRHGYDPHVPFFSLEDIPVSDILNDSTAISSVPRWMKENGLFPQD